MTCSTMKVLAGEFCNFIQNQRYRGIGLAMAGILRMYLYDALNRKVTIYRCRPTHACTYVRPVCAPYMTRCISTPVPTSPRCRLQEHLQLFHQSSLLKCESLASGVVESATPVSAATFYSPVLWIGYDGIFRLREAKASLPLMFGKGLSRNDMLFDRGRTQNHEG